MSGEIGALGDVVTGVALARAVEPEAGEGKSAAGDCLNCGTALTGNHCHMCGQKAKVHRTLSAFWHDLVHSVFHFDGKIWRTLPLLMFRPGQLTRRYVHGERAKFVSPLALFLFCVFLTYAVVSRAIPKDIGVNTPFTPAEAAKELASDRAEAINDIRELEQERAKAVADKENVGWIDGQLARNRAALNKLDAASAEVGQAAISARKMSIEQSRAETLVARLEGQLEAAQKAGQPVKHLEKELKSARTELALVKTAASVFQKKGVDTGEWNFTDLKFAGAGALNDAVKHATENPQLLAYKMQSSAYKFSWALIPISTPFLWSLFFWRRKFKMFDHAVFVTYSLCFMMALTAFGVLLWRVPALAGPATAAMVLLPPVHMFFQLKGAYSLGVFGALWRTFMLTSFAITALTLFALLILLLGLS